MENRNRYFLSPLNEESLRRRRNNMSESLRKKKRSEQIEINRKNRNQFIQEEVDDNTVLNNIFNFLISQHSDSDKYENLLLLKNTLISNPALVLDNEYTLLVMSFLNNEFLAEISASIICDMTTGNNCVQFLYVNFIEIALSLVGKPALTENLLWAIGNIAGDCLSHRRMLLQQGVLECILKYLDNRILSPEGKQASLWTIQNLVNGQEILSKVQISTLLTTLKVVLEEFTLESLQIIEIVSNEGYNGAVCTIELLNEIFVCLNSEDLQVKIQALRIAGNVISRSDNGGSQLVELGLLDTLILTVKSDNFELKIETLWTLSNLAGGNTDLLGTLINHSVLNLALNCLNDPNSQIQIESAWILTNITSRKKYDFTKAVVDLGIISTITLALKHASGKQDIIQKLVCAIRDILVAIPEPSLFVRQEEFVESLENLQLSCNKTNLDMIYYLLDNQFS